jgi:hypothetical protein
MMIPRTLGESQEFGGMRIQIKDAKENSHQISRVIIDA